MIPPGRDSELPPGEHCAPTAAELAERVRTRQISAVHVIAGHLARIEEADGEINAFAHVAAEDALRQARAVDAAVRRGEPVGPLAGVPVSVKDIIATKGMPTGAGSRVLDGYVPDQDATAVARLRRAGAIIIGKTNTPEFALWPFTWSERHGYTRNPLSPPDLPLSPGGSSGGEAAALCAGMSTLGLGSDFGGSVRWPAHCTGLVSLRPTPGRVPADGQVPGLSVRGRWLPNPTTVQGRLQVLGPMGRRVSDVRLAAQVLSGPGRWDDSSAPGPLLSPDTVGLDQVELTWCDGEGTVQVDTEIRRAVAAAAEALQGTVASVSEDRPAALPAAGALFTELRATDQHQDIRRLGAVESFGPTIRELLAGMAPSAPGRLEQLWGQRAALRADMLAQMADVLLMPVAAMPAPPLYDRQFIVEGHVLGLWEPLTPCRAISLFGLPVAVVPVGLTSRGLPIGVQVIARPFREDVALAVAEVLEQRCAPDLCVPVPDLGEPARRTPGPDSTAVG